MGRNAAALRASGRRCRLSRSEAYSCEGGRVLGECMREHDVGPSSVDSDFEVKSTYPHRKHLSLAYLRLLSGNSTTTSRRGR